VAISQEQLTPSLKRFGKNWFFKKKCSNATSGGDADWFKDLGRCTPSAPDPDEPETAGAHLAKPRQRLGSEPYAQTGVTPIKLGGTLQNHSLKAIPNSMTVRSLRNTEHHPDA